MAKSYSLIQSITLSSSASSITFNNIPQNFTDLKVAYSARADEATTAAIGYISFNGSSSNFSNRSLQGNGSSTASFSIAGMAAYTPGTSNTANTFSNGEIYIPNYTSTTTAKSLSSDATVENNATTGYDDFMANLWNPGTQAAITSLSLATSASNWISGSTFYLYGIGGAKATGGTVTRDSTHTYHTFTSTGTFQALEKIKNADVLVIAGGGGGGYGGVGGAGGAGGLCFLPFTQFTAGTTYTAVIGAGGTSVSHGGSPGTTGHGYNGSNSTFGIITAFGGGYGGGDNNGGPSNLSGAPNSGGSGGSGSGSGGRNGGASTQTSGNGVIGYGNVGGNSGGSEFQYYTGGGGGAGGAGGNGSTGGPGIGGAGLGSATLPALGPISVATGTGVGGYYAGGGAGYKQGSNSGFGMANGGGGTSADGVANTGGGGSAAGGWYGGSGLIVVRYPSE